MRASVLVVVVRGNAGFGATIPVSVDIGERDDMTGWQSLLPHFFHPDTWQRRAVLLTVSLLSTLVNHSSVFSLTADWYS